jgi:prepilin-type N-terminal cleavage/methylation domain-containing protein
MTTRRPGFTLIELLTVIVIIGLLATLAIPRFVSARDRALESSVASDLRQLAVKQELHHGDRLTYATDLAALTEYRPSPGVEIEITAAGASGWRATAYHRGHPEYVCSIRFDPPSEQATSPLPQGAVDCRR